MKITDALLGEHAVIYDLFDYVRQTASTSDSIEEIIASVLVLDKVILSHAQIEEDLLFPRLETHMGKMGPLAVMRSEHQGIEDLLLAAKQKIHVGELKLVISQFLELAYTHFQKEEAVLFGLAQQVLDDATLTKMGDEWAACRKVIIEGQGCRGAA